MNSEKPDDGQTGPIGPAGNWVSTFVDYLALKLHLFVIESTEATGHCLRLFVLLGITLGLTVGSILTYGAFILYLVTLLLRLDWGWSALICAVTLTLLAILTFSLLRIGLRKPMFRTSMKELEKDKEWLRQSKTKFS
jgi:uncharacterized membrane protein YqjE